MRAAPCLALLLALLAPQALATGAFQVDTILLGPSGQASPSQRPAPNEPRPAHLDAQAARLSPANGYQVLLHKAWTRATEKVAVEGGALQAGHFPVAGNQAPGQGRGIQAVQNPWVDPLDPRGLITGSERLKRSASLKAGELTDLHHTDLGVLSKVTPL